MQGPTETATLAGVMEDLARRGFTEHFTAAPGGLHAVESGKTFLADQLTIAEYHRFEGASDPGDMAIVYAIEARSGVRGTLADAFGVYADPRVGAVVKDVVLRMNSPIRSTAR
ncbi:MAG: phosphoribosylpyrophosphate synthetase [Candidatus Rokuibacteriota bacterium]|nr:MAG: phosphoribosylpyrophosphate synthetase [Candidatus Rokubacteria bacterium]